MDPASVLSLVCSIKELIGLIYKVAQDARAAKDEIRALALELTLLKASLEHIQTILDLEKLSVDKENNNVSVLQTSSLTSPEFQQMLSSTNSMIQEVAERFQSKANAASKAWQALTWHMKKEDVESYIKRLERAKTWFILATTSDNTVLLRDMLRTVSSVELTLSQEAQENERRRLQQEQIRIRQWLAPHNTDAIYQVALERLHPKTGEWFFNRVQDVWSADTSQETRIWFQARPGFGKTTLMAGAIRRALRYAQERESAPLVAYHFCSFMSQPSQDVRNVLGNLIFQCCCAKPSLFEEINKLYPKKQNSTKSLDSEKLSVDELENLFAHILDSVDSCCLFVDAINESQDIRLLLVVLGKLLRRGSGVHLLITSTEDVDTEPLTHHLQVLTVSQKTNADDISLYIDSCLANDHKFGPLPNAIKLEIRHELMSNARGVFRWLQCQIQTLQAQGSIKDIRKALRNLPDTLEQTYYRILENIQPEKRGLARNMLLWVSCSWMPMRLSELCEAVILNDEEEEVDETMRLLRPNDMLDVCPGLISYDNRKQELTLAHSSVFAFLTSDSLRQSKMKDFYLDLALSHNIFGKYCLKYLLMQDLASGYVRGMDSLQERLEAWPLLSYIGLTLWEYLRDVDPNGPLRPLLMRFFASQKLPRAGNFGSWVQLFTPQLPSHHIESSTPLYYAAREGHLSLLRIILSTEGNASLEQGGGTHLCTPLHVASWQGHSAIVRELLAAGADAIHEKNDVGETALYWAIVMNHHDIIQMLMAAGAKLDGTEDNYRGILAQRVKMGYLVREIGL